MAGVRIGLWNRLAIVASALTMLVLPFYVILQAEAQQQDGNLAQLKLCREIANLKKDDVAYEGCWPLYQRALIASDGINWSYYREVVLATLIFVAVLYLLIFAVVSTAKWVWRGRSASKDERPS